MLIIKYELPIDIITNKDIRNKIANYAYPITAKAKV